MSAERSYLLVRVGTWICALPVQLVVETMRPQPILPVSSDLPFVRGVSRVRGALLPVLDLALLLGVPVFEPARRFITVRSDTQKLCLMTGEVVRVTALDEELLQETPQLLRAALPAQVERLGTLDGAAVATLSTARLLPEEAWRSLASERDAGRDR